MDIDQNSDIDPQKESSNPAELKQIIRNMRRKNKMRQEIETRTSCAQENYSMMVQYKYELKSERW
jgi:hypothetical protein